MTVQANPPTILCTWEMGAELGHISRLCTIVKALEKSNYRVFVALKDLSRAHGVFKDTQATLLQAPVWLPVVKMQRPIACLADALLLLGYLEADALHSLVSAWRALIKMVQPDLVIFDYSPTAMLALQQDPVAKILTGSGFADPVPGHSVTDWRPYPVKDDLIPRQERRVLEVINEVLRRFDKTELKQLADLFEVDCTFITTFKEFDPYADVRKKAVHCIGAVDRPAVDVAPSTTRHALPRIVAYLKPGYPQLTLLVKALAQCEAQIFIACPRGNPQLFEPFKSNHFDFSTDVVDLPLAIKHADLFVGHGNATSVKESLSYGKPVVVFPIQLEQLLLGKKVQSLGLGRLVEKIDSVESVVAVLNTALITNAYRSQVQQFLDAAGGRRASLGPAVAECCNALLA